MAGTGFPLGGANLKGTPSPVWLRFIKFVCENERIVTLVGGGDRQHPLDLPMIFQYEASTFHNVRIVIDRFGIDVFPGFGFVYELHVVLKVREQLEHVDHTFTP